MYLYGIEITVLLGITNNLDVLIVPLWNWNPSAHIKTGFFSPVLIVPLWNWNIVLSRWRRLMLRCSNCTFMELKYPSWCTWFCWVLVLIVPLWNWNQDLANKYIKDKIVLIVPLWNWNYVANTSNQIELCSNCTFMELKY